MTKAGIEYIRGIYQTAIERRKESKDIPMEYSRGYMQGYHTSTIELCASIAQFERFSLLEPQKGE